ncbi:flavin monoamine oxidase family protein [Streptomyces sp. DSM 40750]|uniref:flavin monoamine oxidase family protein n=1 Tax=Streptomyces sp. DSM 40750 TaxID=2801030 RepID=UPI00214B5ECF|nr:FAD-dependent oxidoreductase [Streptomyces sp. DSM 40750]UUU25877.1 FAD-dependent oxidoreductase [Streptomyces sp. DSM 40750]
MLLTTLQGNGPSSPRITMLCPDFPFAYDDWLRHPAGLGGVPAGAMGTEVAIVGGGIAGLVAAYELMRMGLRPVLHEAGRLGGRMRSAGFDGFPDEVAELGAMRFPLSAAALFHYVRTLGLRTTPFANPLSPCTPMTVLDIGGVSHWARTEADLPPVYREVADAWDKTLREQADVWVMQEAIRTRDTATIKAMWNRLVPLLDDQSFYGFLSSTPAFASFRLRELFGQVGFGTGGWDTDFPNSMLEILRVVYTEADADHQAIEGGCEQVPLGLWRHAPEGLTHWPAGTSLAALHENRPRPAVTALRRAGEHIEVTDADGRTRGYRAVVFTGQHRLLNSRVACDDALLPGPVRSAIERTHYMSSSKLFALTDRPFWLDVDAATGRDVMGMTLTDRLPRSVYLFGREPGRPGVMCLSYTWNDDSQRVAALSAEERLEVVLRSLGEIYPGVDIRSHIIAPPVAISWENEPWFTGAFKANLPGHYRYQRRLFTHFMQSALPEHQRGFFLAGDDVSWTGGFAEGAVTTALNAVWGVVRHLGGGCHSANPGPGDVFAELAPLELDEL